MSAVILFSRMPLRGKVDAIHSLFDFNQSGQLTIDELTLLLRTAVTGCAKLDKTVTPPEIDELEHMSQWAFDKADRAYDDEITKPEFDSYVFTEPKAAALLTYCAGVAGQVVIEPGAKWIDDTHVSLYAPELAAAPPAGLPRESVVQLLRPADFVSGGVASLFAAGTAVGRIVRGAWSDSALLSAMAMLVPSRRVRSIFVRTGQEESGRFAVSLFRCGISHVVFVDDRFACDCTRWPLGAHTTDPCELWVSFLEKAAAKFLGSYAALATLKVRRCPESRRGVCPR